MGRRRRVRVGQRRLAPDARFVVVFGRGRDYHGLSPLLRTVPPAADAANFTAPLWRRTGQRLSDRLVIGRRLPREQCAHGHLVLAVAGAAVVVFIAEECRGGPLGRRAPLRDRWLPLRPLAAVRRVDVVVAARRTRLLHRPALRLQSGRERRRFSGEVALAGRCCPRARRRCGLAELRAMPRRPRLRVIALEAFFRLLQRVLLHP